MRDRLCCSDALVRVGLALERCTLLPQRLACIAAALAGATAAAAPGMLAPQQAEHRQQGVHSDAHQCCDPAAGAAGTQILEDTVGSAPADLLVQKPPCDIKRAET